MLEYNNLGEPERLQNDSSNPALAREWARIFVCLCAYHWPGNVREMRNIVRQLVIYNNGADVVTLPRHIVNLLAQEDVKPEQTKAFFETLY